MFGLALGNTCEWAKEIDKESKAPGAKPAPGHPAEEPESSHRVKDAPSASKVLTIHGR
jgi:hypothetical protein